MTLLFELIALCLGLAFGSFANVIIFRFGVEKSNLTSRSRCMTCAHPISTWENIPVVSWLLLRGRCRNCHTQISPIYPIVETVTALLFLCFMTTQAESLDGVTMPGLVARFAILFALFWLAVAGVSLAVIDFRNFVLPNVLVYSTFLVGFFSILAASIALGDLPVFLRSISSSVISVAAFWVIHRLAPRGMGFGDVKLSAALGLYMGWFGWGALVIGWLFAFLSASIFGISQVTRRRAKLGSAIAFGPWMILGTFIGLFSGVAVWGAYLNFLQQVIG